MLNKRSLWSRLTCWRQRSPSHKTRHRLTVWPCLLWDLSLCAGRSKRSPHAAALIIVRDEMEETENLRPWLNPAVTQHTRRDVWLDSLNYSHRRSLAALNHDRFLSSCGLRAPLLTHTHTHLWHSSSKIVLRDDSQRFSAAWYALVDSLKEIPLVAQLHTLLLWSISNGKSPEECSLPAAHTQDWSERSECHQKAHFPPGTREKTCKCRV